MGGMPIVKRKVPKVYKEDILKHTIQEKECGHKISRGDVRIATHKHANGAFVNDEAREIGEKIKAYELTSSSFILKEISNIDFLAYVFGSREHCGRVRGLGLGPCPSKVFGCNSHSYSGTSSSLSSYTHLQNQASDQGSVPNDETNDQD
ncbi:hypothetical protein VNO80_01583 [Phaseolus coccineus]|uniref:Uncharacterized protein n=1 Tax=Phaseolus coccineus TaxID=3886 RepID=A0AAN9WWZ0_PHACN